ncbi:MAG: Transcription termination factor Rho [Chlamydiia bacterium]|nr:Transcription termination factor Rho [Chlamydiia bacterium]
MTEDEKQPKKEKNMTSETTEKPAESNKETKETKAAKPSAAKPAAPKRAAPKAKPADKPDPSLLTPPPLVKQAASPAPKPIAKPTAKPPAEGPSLPQQSHHNEQNHKRNPRQKYSNQQNRNKKQNFGHKRNNREHSVFVEPDLPEVPEGVEVQITKIKDLQKMSFDQLTKYAAHIGIESLTNMNRSQIVFTIIKESIHKPGQILIAEGTLEILPDGFGFLRSPQYHYQASAEDIYVSPSQIRHYGLKKGDDISGPIRLPKDKDKYFALLRVDTMNTKAPKDVGNRKAFDNFTPIHPTERLMMETKHDNYSTRVIDLVSPIGKGQRALIVAPPKAGKTILLQNIINAVSINNPKVKLLILLIDERPEEVTDMQRLINDKGQVIASTFDEPPERHTIVAEMCIEKAKRMVEEGEDVVIVLDSITRLARAYNTVQPHSGKILSGGVDANAMHKPKRFFGAARNLEEGGSLTIIGSALIDTGSKMDEVIYEEFKGTGNLELVLDRRLADRRLYPAIDAIKSGTRKEDLLYHKDELEKVYKLRAALADLSPADAMNLILSRMKKTKANTEFLLSLKD